MTTQEKYSDENIREKIIAKINKAFGKNHKVKVALFKAISNHNDEYDEYSPILILIDKNFKEIEHNIKVYDLCPDDEEQYDVETDETTSVNDVTVNFD